MVRRRGNRRSAAEAARLVEGYERSGLTRAEYCRRAGIPVTTLDYYRRRQSEHKQPGQQPAHLLPVTIIPAGLSRGFVLALSNGRRIESDWGFSSEELARLVRVAEQA